MKAGQGAVGLALVGILLLTMGALFYLKIVLPGQRDWRAAKWLSARGCEVRMDTLLPGFVQGNIPEFSARWFDRLVGLRMRYTLQLEPLPEDMVLPHVASLGVNFPTPQARHFPNLQTIALHPHRSYELADFDRLECIDLKWVDEVNEGPTPILKLVNLPRLRAIEPTPLFRAQPMHEGEPVFKYRLTVTNCPNLTSIPWEYFEKK